MQDKDGNSGIPAATLSAAAVLQRYRAGNRDFRGLALCGLDLRGLDLRDADLQDADLRGANLSGANLRSADLRGANLSRANLQSADLLGTDLRGANLEGALTTTEDFATAQLTTVPTEDPVMTQPILEVDLSDPRPTQGSDRQETVSFGYLDRASAETTDLKRQLRSLRLWQGILAAVALGLLFVTVLGGYLGYAQYRDYRQLQERFAAQERARANERATAEAELQRLSQERQRLETTLQAEVRRDRDRDLQVEALRNQLQAARRDLAAAQERLKELTETNDTILEERRQPQERRFPWLEREQP